MSGAASEVFYTAADGLRLHAIDFASATAAAADGTARLPVVCLPGLARTTMDFDPVGEALAHRSARPRRVVAFDYRGRGGSERDPDWRHYDLETERRDFLDGLAHLGIGAAHFLGTSRGGLHILALAPHRPDLIRSAIFNDIGPVLEPEGLRRIKGYIGRSGPLKTWAEAIAVLKLGGGQHFDGLTAAEWQIFAETTFGRDERRFGLQYDPQLARVLDGLDLAKPLPESWDLFDALRGRPVLTIRGANSDLLSEATLAKMGGRWPESETLTVPGQGHAPLLVDEATIARIDRFLAAADAFEPESQRSSES